MVEAGAVVLDERRAVHLVGVGGAGISGIAVILATMGHRVSGVDVTETPAWPALAAAGVAAHVVAPEDLFASAAATGADLVAHSTAFPPSRDDRVAAEAAGRRIVDRATILGAICATRPTVAVAGTHGKTSTTAMLATLLTGVGADPSFLVGAVPAGLDIAARWGGPDGVFVVEADESDGSFLALGASTAVVTNIEEDHLDYWGDLDAIEAGFDRFVAEADRAVVCVDRPDSSGRADDRGLRVANEHEAITIGEASEARHHVHDVAVERLTTSFGLTLDGVEVGPVRIGTPGRHHARNAAVAVVTAVELGVEATAAVDAIGAYRGVARRFSVVGEAGGVTVVDDYADNPGKVGALVASAVEAGWGRVVVVFQPHRYTRTATQGRAIGAALAAADVVAITDVYAAGEEPIEGVSGRVVVDGLLDERPWADVAWMPTVEDSGDVGERSGASRRPRPHRRRRRRASRRAARGRCAGEAVILSPPPVAGAVAALAAELGDRAEADVPLGPYTTYRVGGPAALLTTVSDDAALAALAPLVAASGVPVLVVGKGSNLLVADAGFPGLAIRLGEAFADIAVDGTTVRAGAAASLPVVARRTAAASLTGFEWAVGVPGSIGGAVRMNAGGHGSDMAASLVRIRVVDLAAGEDGVVDAADLALGYRTSSIRPSQVVVWAELALAPGDRATSEAEISEIVRWRREHQPGGPNAGSVFTNPPGDSAGRLIDAAGGKGLRVGTAEVSTKHANFIQADEGGSADDVWALMAEVQRRVREHSGVDLHPETRTVGFEPT